MWWRPLATAAEVNHIVYEVEDEKENFRRCRSASAALPFIALTYLMAKFFRRGEKVPLWMERFV